MQSGLRGEFSILITNAALRHLAEPQIPPRDPLGREDPRPSPRVGFEAPIDLLLVLCAISEVRTPLEGTGFEPSVCERNSRTRLLPRVFDGKPHVPLLRKALLGVPIGDGDTKGGATYRSRSEAAMLAWSGSPWPFSSWWDREFESCFLHRGVRASHHQTATRSACSLVADRVLLSYPGQPPKMHWRTYGQLFNKAESAQ